MTRKEYCVHCSQQGVVSAMDSFLVRLHARPAKRNPRKKSRYKGEICPYSVFKAKHKLQILSAAYVPIVLRTFFYFYYSKSYVYIYSFICNRIFLPYRMNESYKFAKCKEWEDLLVNCP